MDDRIARLESSVGELQAAIGRLQQRLDAVEAQGLRLAGAASADAADRAAPDTPAEAAAAPIPRDPYDPILILSLIGRLFLVLAGGFFLRAMTEAGVLADPVGIAAAFAYGLVWLVLADRAGRRRQFTSVIFHALAAALVVFPLLVEATTRFRVVDGVAAALIIAALSAGFLLVAWRQRVQAVAWVALLAALPTGVILMIKTAVVAHFGLYLVALGLAALWAGYRLDWRWLRWPAALTVDLVIVGVTVRALSELHRDLVPVALLLHLALLGGYLASFAIRSLVRDREVAWFEVLQTAAALVIGFGGILYLTRANGTLPVVLGWSCVLLGAVCYAVVFAIVERRAERKRNLYYYTTLALVLVLSGLTLALGPPAFGALLALLAVTATFAWSRRGHLYLLLHGAIYSVAAVIACGALAYGAMALAAHPAGAWVRPDGLVMGMLAAAAAAAWYAAARPHPQGGLPANAMRLVIDLVLVWVLAACVTGVLAPLLAGVADRGVNGGALATLRTGVLAFLILATAAIGGRARFREWTWLVYPLLVAVGLKMVVQDFKDSRPATLFIALALYGAALILAPRLKRAGRIAQTVAVPRENA